MKLSFLALPLIYICANGYLYVRTLQAFTWLPLWGKILLSLIFWMAAFALFVSIGLRESQFPVWIVHTLFSVGSVWCVFLLYSVLLLVVADVAKLVFPSMGQTLWYALPVSCALLVYGYVNYRNPKVEHLNLALEGKSAGEKMRIVAISDVHLGYGTGVKALERYVEMINAQNPDVVLIVGDLIDNSVKPLLNKPFDAVLSKIRAPQGIYMVPGNHEYISNMDKAVDYLKNTSVVLLRDSVVTLPNGIQIVGRDDRSNRRRKSLSDLLASTDKHGPTIVLDHQPYHVAQADSLGVDVLLCGHTHHGQVFPFNLVTDHLYEQSHGYRKWSHTHVWVSSGLSLWGPPFRIGTQSDLAVIELE